MEQDSNGQDTGSAAQNTQSQMWPFPTASKMEQTPSEEQKLAEEKSFRDKLANLLNSVSAENRSNTPDFLLASFLASSLKAFDEVVLARDHWYGIELSPCGQQYEGSVVVCKAHNKDD